MDRPCRHADDCIAILNILRDNCACADGAVVADFDAGEYGGTDADEGVVADLAAAAEGGSWGDVGVDSDSAIVFDD